MIIPNFKEPVDVMRLMLTNLAECAPDGMARGQLHVVLAIEAREGPDAVARADRLRNEFESKFAAKLKGSIGEGSNHSNLSFSKISAKFRQNFIKI